MQSRRRRLTAALGACAAVLGLAGCERPTPIVTLYSSGTSLYDYALSYCFEGQDPAREPGTEGACRFDTAGRSAKVLEVRPGEEVLVDVDRELSESGWVVVLRGSQQGQASRLATQEDEHVTHFQPDFTQSPVITVEVQRLERPAEDARPTGIWQFQIVPG